jgi:ubiquinone/menaquinone biosynthesis C-methylase UbiE
MQTQNNQEKIRGGTYDELAPEYYDSKKHPTSANFREASKALITPWLSRLLRPQWEVMEVGAGRSVVAEWLTETGRTVASLWITDSSLEMLSYSSGFDANLVQCDARHMPFTANSFEVIVSSLGDPYDTSAFWKETSRVLKPGGYILFTTPSFQWAAKFRGGVKTAEFQLHRGEVIRVPSFVRPRFLEERMIKHAGLTVLSSAQFHDQGIWDSPRSPKLREGPIVTGYIVQKS